MQVTSKHGGGSVMVWGLMSSRGVGEPRKGRETTVEERRLIMQLHSGGKSYAEVGKVTNRSRKTVFSIVQIWKEEKTLVNRPRQGRPQKLTNKDNKKIFRTVKNDPRTTAPAIAAELAEGVDAEFSCRAVRRCLNSAGYNIRVPRRKPFVSKCNAKKRMVFAEEIVGNDVTFWDKILRNDECKFTLSHWTAAV
ncbi:uncharacterized protein LOC126455304 [Schistocerca serialis cubense]|uniref:uncharacterized protein LOC126455304 n=1 Tax=Schistocerca serialis cubense TaxID=2023355 RepID=UPI00214E6F32|nr:uncharacterized protein LOC126455304 [Schistocerca serialis cubense]